ncbi:hypothetical protein RQP46_008002 [Phenoliferia psychrophenolica]
MPGELTPDLLRDLNGPVILTSAAQLILWGFLVSHAGSFVHTPAWRKLSRPIQCAIGVVLTLVTISTGTAMQTLWNFAVDPPKTFFELASIKPTQILNVVVIGLVAAVTQAIMTVRARKVVPEGRCRRYFTWAIAVLILVELLAWVLFVLYVSSHFMIRAHIQPTANAVDGTALGLNAAQIVIMWITLEMGVDVIISDIWILKSRLGGAGVSFLRITIQLTLQSALLTTILTVVEVGLYISAMDIAAHPLEIRAGYACFIPQSALYGISLFYTLSIAEKSRKKTDAYVVTFASPDAVPLPPTFEKMEDVGGC